MDITTVFGTVIVGSNPAGRTKVESEVFSEIFAIFMPFLL